jgi:organic radical activating enzyme
MSKINTKFILPFLEIMPIQGCNLSCTGCSNYSDLTHRGYLSWAQGQSQIAPWLDRIDIPDFGIIGGEPLMNPGILDWILGARALLPSSQIRFTTNGLLLDKFPDIMKIFMEIGNCVFKITRHVSDPKLERNIQKIFSEYTWRSVTEYGISRFVTGNNVRFQINSPQLFYKSFKGMYNNMLPYHSDPDDAFDLCYQQTCPLLYNGKIYKCSSNGLLVDTLNKFDNPNFEQWEPYINNGLDIDCSDAELEKFINNFGKSHKICGMCPTRDNTESYVLHFDNVNQIKIKSAGC